MNAIAILNAVGDDPNDVVDWIKSSDDREFDAGCVALIVNSAAICGVRGVSAMLQAMRDRYRRLPKDRSSRGGLMKWAKATTRQRQEFGSRTAESRWDGHHLNEWQVRIIRRVRKGHHGVGCRALAEHFFKEFSASTIYHVREGRVRAMTPVQEIWEPACALADRPACAGRPSA
ncbi:MAG TPA: hypothetical protein VGA18_05175 [Rhodothermales bacterium]